MWAIQSRGLFTCNMEWYGSKSIYVRRPNLQPLSCLYIMLWGHQSLMLGNAHSVFHIRSSHPLRPLVHPVVSSLRICLAKYGIWCDANITAVVWNVSDLWKKLRRHEICPIWCGSLNETINCPVWSNEDDYREKSGFRGNFKMLWESSWALVSPVFGPLRYSKLQSNKRTNTLAIFTIACSYNIDVIVITFCCGVLRWNLLCARSVFTLWITVNQTIALDVNSSIGLKHRLCKCAPPCDRVPQSNQCSRDGRSLPCWAPSSRPSARTHPWKHDPHVWFWKSDDPTKPVGCDGRSPRSGLVLSAQPSADCRNAQHTRPWYFPSNPPPSSRPRKGGGLHASYAWTC